MFKHKAPTEDFVNTFELRFFFFYLVLCDMVAVHIQQPLSSINSLWRCFESCLVRGKSQNNVINPYSVCNARLKQSKLRVNDPRGRTIHLQDIYRVIYLVFSRLPTYTGYLNQSQYFFTASPAASNKIIRSHPK